MIAGLVHRESYRDLFFITGAYINKRLKLNLTGAAKMCFLVSCFGLVSSSMLFLKCDTPSITGVNTPYPNR